jgi:hypothetical protein
MVLAPKASELPLTIIETVPSDAPVLGSCVAITVPVPIMLPLAVSVTVPVGGVAPLSGEGEISELTVNVPPPTEAALDVTVLVVGAWVMVKAIGVAAVLALRLLSPL